MPVLLWPGPQMGVMVRSRTRKALCPPPQEPLRSHQKLWATIPGGEQVTARARQTRCLVTAREAADGGGAGPPVNGPHLIRRISFLPYFAWGPLACLVFWILRCQTFDEATSEGSYYRASAPVVGNYRWRCQPPEVKSDRTSHRV